MQPSLPQHIASKIVIDADSGCWLWIGGKFTGGYGQAWWEGHGVNAHRLVYHLLIDPALMVRPGQRIDQLDHLCRVRHCVNPDHLERVTGRENRIRAQVLRSYSSRFVGVTWNHHRRKWNAQIQADGHHYYLGAFYSEVAAAITYDNAAESYHGDRTNERLGLLEDESDDDFDRLAP